MINRYNADLLLLFQHAVNNTVRTAAVAPEPLKAQAFQKRVLAVSLGKVPYMIKNNSSGFWVRSLNSCKPVEGLAGVKDREQSS